MRELKYSSWEFNSSKCPVDFGTHHILSLQEAADFCNEVKNEFIVGLTSGGFDPIHDGHISCILEARTKCDILIAVVNGDEFLKRKKGAAFMPLNVRSRIVSGTKGVDVTVPFDASNPLDMTVCEPLRIIRPNIFFKGGDRKEAKQLPEYEVCREFNICIDSECGDEKISSSSNYLRQWTERNKNGDQK